MPPRDESRRHHAGQRTTYVADAGNDAALRGDLEAGVAGGGGDLLPGSLHVGGARGDGAPVGGGAAAGPGAAVSGDLAADGRVDDDGDAGRALASPRRGRLPLGP